MAFDTFDEGIALGGLRSKHEIKVLMCYLFNSVKDKMSESVITEAIREYELANFFEVKAAFDELKRSENLLLAERKTLRENFVDIVKTDDGFQVNCRVSGGDTDLFSFTLYAPDEEMAQLMKKNFLSPCSRS